MPSPVGHSLAALAIAAAARTSGQSSEGWRWSAVLVGASVAADVDFVTAALWPNSLYLVHHGVTHSVGAAVVAGAVAATVATLARVDRPVWCGLLVALAYASHVVMDFFAGDVGVPTDMPIFWPLMADTWIATPAQIFAAIEHNNELHGLPAVFMRSDTWMAIAREVVLMGSVLTGVSLLKRGRRPDGAVPERDRPRRDR